MTILERPPNPRPYASPLRLLIIIATSVFMTEAGVMILLFILPPMPEVVATIFDALLLTVLIYPVLYRYVMRPMTQHIADREQVEAALRRAHDELELRVEERTEELTIANAELQEEIDERQRVETRLRESQADLKRAQAVAHTGSWRLDVRRNELRWSDETYRMFGIPWGTPLTYETFFATVHPDDRAYVDQKWTAALHGEPYDIEHRIMAGDVEKWVRERAELEFDQHGTLLGGFGIVHDITERRQAEETMAWLASFPQFNPNPVVEVDLVGHIQYLNPSAQRLLPDLATLGLQHPWLAGLEAVGKQFQLNGMTIIVREVTVGDAVYQQTLHFVSNYQRIRIYASDITERKRMEVALRRAHDELELRVQERTAALAQLSSAVEQTADSVVITDQNGIIEYVNPAFERLTGYTRAEAVGRTPRVIKSGLHDAQFYEDMWQTILSGEAYFGELTNRKKNGELFHEVKTIAPIRDAQGVITHFVATGKDITERKRSEEALRASELRFRTVADFTYDWEYWNNPDQKPLYVSPSCERITGYHPAEFIADPDLLARIIHPDDRELYASHLHSATQRGDLAPIDFRIIRRDGQVCWIGHVCQPVYDEQGHALGRRISNRDITERKQAEQALQQSEKKFRTLFETAPVGISVLDQEHRITDANPAMERLTGLAQAELVTGTRQRPQFIRSDGTPMPPGEFASARAIADGQPTRDVEVGIVIEDGQTIWTLISAAPLGLPEASVVVITQDITERKRAEGQIKLQIAAMEAAANGIVITDHDGRIQWTNPAFTRMSGYAAQEIVSQHTRLFKSGQHDRAYYQQLWDTILAGQVWHGETINRRKDGSLYTEDQTIAPVHDAQGKVTHFVSIKQDITEHKRAEKEIERRNRELAALNVVSAAVSRSLELSEVLLTLAHLLPEDLSIPGGAIFLYDESADQLHFETGWGAPGALHSASFGATVSATAFHSPRVIRDKEPLLTSDVRHAVESVAAKLNLSQPDWQDYLCVPLVAQDRLQGVFDLFSRAPAQFSADDVKFFKALGQEVGIAIQNARLYEAEQHARQTAETLRAASLALTRTLDLNAVVNSLLDYVEQLIPYDAAKVMLLESENHLAARAVRGYEHAGDDGDRRRHLTVDISATPIVSQLLTERRSLIIADGLIQPDQVSGLQLAPARSWLGVPLIAGGSVIGLYSLIKVEPNYFTLRHMQLAEALVGQAAVAVQNAWLFEQVRQGRERLQDLSRRLVEVQESERRYIARELHDEAGQALTSLMVGLRLLERDAGQPEALKSGIAELNRLVDGVQENLHRLAVDLRPASLDHLGLVAALRQYVESLSDKYGLVVQFEAVGLGHERLPSDVETAIYRIVQEALTNVIRHAHATRADVLLERRGDRLVAMVEDNGIGFDVAQPQTGRLGLFGIRERAEMLGGTLLIESTEHRGTTLAAEVSCVS